MIIAVSLSPPSRITWDFQKLNNKIEVGAKARGCFLILLLRLKPRENTMRYKLLGNSGLRVSELCLGGMTFGTDWGWGADKDTSRQIYEAFREAGGNFIDTANFYTNSTSEKLIGEFVAQERERVVLATKYSTSMDDDNPNGTTRRSQPGRDGLSV